MSKKIIPKAIKKIVKPIIQPKKEIAVVIYKCPSCKREYKEEIKNDVFVPELICSRDKSLMQGMLSYEKAK